MLIQPWTITMDRRDPKKPRQDIKKTDNNQAVTPPGNTSSTQKKRKNADSASENTQLLQPPTEDSSISQLNRSWTPNIKPGEARLPSTYLPSNWSKTSLKRANMLYDPDNRLIIEIKRTNDELTGKTSIEVIGTSQLKAPPAAFISSTEGKHPMPGTDTPAVVRSERYEELKAKGAVTKDAQENHLIPCVIHGDFIQIEAAQSDHLQPIQKIIQRQQYLINRLNEDKDFANEIMELPNMEDFFVSFNGKILGTKLFYDFYYNDIDNIWLICQACNLHKSSESPIKWLEEKWLYGKQFQQHVKDLGGVQNDGILIKIAGKGLAEVAIEWFWKNQSRYIENIKNLRENTINRIDKYNQKAARLVADGDLRKANEYYTKAEVRIILSNAMAHASGIDSAKTSGDSTPSSSSPIKDSEGNPARVPSELLLESANRVALQLQEMATDLFFADINKASDLTKEIKPLNTEEMALQKILLDYFSKRDNLDLSIENPEKSGLQLESKTEMLITILNDWQYSESKKDRQILSDQIRETAEYFGFICEDVSDDGNCFFHAVKKQLENNPNFQNLANQEKLREIAVEHIIKNIDYYANFAEGDIDTFIEKISTPGEWADNIMIQAISRALNLNIIIIQSDGSMPTIIRRKEPDYSIFLGYEVGLHYQSLKLLSNTLHQDLQMLIKNTEIDINLPSTESQKLKDDTNRSNNQPINRGIDSSLTSQSNLYFDYTLQLPADLKQPAQDASEIEIYEYNKKMGEFYLNKYHEHMALAELHNPKRQIQQTNPTSPSSSIPSSSPGRPRGKIYGHYVSLQELAANTAANKNPHQKKESLLAPQSTKQTSTSSNDTSSDNDNEQPSNTPRRRG